VSGDAATDANGNRAGIDQVGRHGREGMPWAGDGWNSVAAPSVVTMSVLRRLVGFTFKVLSFDGC
jgi:hypothetical protein